MSTKHGPTEQPHHHGHGDWSGMAETLNLDALLLKEHFVRIFEWIKNQSAEPRTIVDLGAGTGTGTFGLARTFPHATVTAIDQSVAMLELLRENAEQQQLSGRISTLNVDLDEQWPALNDVDLVWAATSMHHFKDPAQIFGRIRDSLCADGVLVIVEMEAFPRYLPADLGFGKPGLEERCHLATAPEGFNPHPDWTAELETAGYTTITQRTFNYAQSAGKELLARSATLSLSRLRSRLTDGLPAADLAMLNELLDPDSEHAVVHRNDLAMHGSHNVWAAKLK